MAYFIETQCNGDVSLINNILTAIAGAVAVILLVNGKDKIVMRKLTLHIAKNFVGLFEAGVGDS